MNLAEMFTVNSLGTMAGMIAFTVTLTQITKFLTTEKVLNVVSSRLIALFWSAIANIFVLLMNGNSVSVEGIFVCIVNTLLVTAASFGTFDFGAKTIDKNEGESEE